MSERFKEFAINRGDEAVTDQVACEEPLQITIDGTPVAVVMRTPGDDDLLVRGFLLTEGLLGSLGEMWRLDAEAKKNHVLVFLADDVSLDHSKFSRNLFSASSCGICGKASINSIQQNYPPVESGFEIAKDVLLGVPDTMRGTQKVFSSTGGLHAAALVSAAGDVLVLKEDVGRHNAIDKVIGWGAVQGVDFSNLFLQVSGRVSFEVMQKSLAVGIPMVSAISAPTSLAVEFARESGQTLVGFLRPPTINIYAGAGRIV